MHHYRPLGLAILLTTGLSLPGIGQQAAGTLAGEEAFEKETITHTTTVLQNGRATFEFGANARRRTAYTFTGESDGAVQIKERMAYLADTISAFGKEAIYTTDRAFDTASLFGVALHHLKTRGQTARATAGGKLVWERAAAETPAYPALATFLGLGPEPVPCGSPASWQITLPRETALAKGYEWTEGEEKGPWKSSTRYTVQARTDTTLTVAYTAAAEGRNESTKTNGMLVLDPRTGRVRQRVANTITVGHLRLNGVWCTVDSRTACAERFGPGGPGN